nr:MAG TPA: BAF1 / ABF1 chromatin reorganizing factor [Caudoviricetes sp.]DAW61550.1 MAG TPA: BAF1 / ABF1 chromatin reorganizing factor [Caudoviricetes sp.]
MYQPYIRGKQFSFCHLKSCVLRLGLVEWHGEN